MTFSLNTRFLVGKAEGTPGTMETLTGLDFNTRCRGVEITPILEWDDEASKFASGGHGEEEAISGAQSATITFSIRLGRGDTVATNPNYTKYLNGCGIKEVAYSTTGIGFQPLKEYDVKTLTLWVYDVVTGGATPGALVYKFAGAMGNVTIGCDGIGKPWVATFTFTAKLIDIVDAAYAAIPQGVDFDTAHPEKNINTSVAYAGVAQRISSFTLDAGNEISPVINQADVTGYDYYQITNRKPRFSTNPLAQSVATEDILGRMLSGLTGSDPVFVTGMHVQSGTTGMRISAPRAQQIQANVANREGIVSWDANYRFLANGWTGAVADASLAPDTCWEMLIGTRA